jgi:ABC-type sugar transport system ATPase subunit
MFFRNFAIIMLEMNEVLLKGGKHACSMMAEEGQVTCLTTPGADLSSTPLRWLYAVLGFEPVTSGFISLDGEPLTVRSAAAMRRFMSFVPFVLDDVGEITIYHAPTAHDVYALKANRRKRVRSLQDEMKLTGAAGQQARLMATAVLLERPVLLVDRPQPSAMPYLHRLAEAGRTVIVASNDTTVKSSADNIVEIIDYT